MRIRLSLSLAILLLGCHESDAQQARNVILFLADAGGVPTVNAASIHGYNEPQKLFIQSWPHVALSDTSTASQWVSDSAAGMTAIVTGRKTHNGVISMGPDAVRGERDGTALKTLLEYAEERGLSTGVVSNMNIADATPAACYAHANARNKLGEIFLQVFTPRFGDGVDVVLGNGRRRIADAITALGQDLDAVAAANRRPVYASLAAVPASDARPIAVLDGGLDVPAAAGMAIERLSRNRKGYFLMIEWDAHTDDPRKGLDNLVAFDTLIRDVAKRVNLEDTLLLFTADHSFDFSVHGGRRGEPLLKGLEEWQKDTAGKSPPHIELPSIRVHDDHTAEEVVVAAIGPGAQRVSGFMPNTRLFEIMLAAWGWQEDAATGAPGLQAGAPGQARGPRSRIERDTAVAVRQPGPHDGGGLTTAYPFFADLEDLPLVFRKRALHAGSSIGAHTQEDDEIYYVIGGTGEYTLDGQTSTVSAGSALLTRRGSTHSLRQTGKGDLVILIAYLRRS